ncbi:MAG: M20/M25/M40 family metallo-hydrolase, partial [Acidobacteria bacterium]|nr:M20/M25/M40 family metallo-hydrolase [Acidobacteriota bacterium]
MSSSSQSSAAESVLERVQGISALAAMAEVRKAIQWFRDQESRFTQWQVEVARIPAPPFGEQARSEWLAEKFSSLGLVDVHRDAIGNVLGMRPGIQAGAVSLSAHLDTVFPAATPLDIRRQGRKLCGPGISDNAAGIVALLALAMACREFRLPHDASLVFIGNVGEEGEGDLRGMRYVFSTSRWREGILSSVVLDGAGADTVIAEALGSRRFEIVMRGPGGHSWSDFGAPNPIVAMARAIHGFSDTHIPSSPKTTVNVGVIAGGTSVNSIPESASIRVDIRSSSAAEIDRLETELRRMVEHAVQAELAHSEPPRLAHS